ncbi:hypothetical protein BHE74_00019226 [Ensete ventricosum]|nr:hypothetical protein BHE74_00019226 [Ensete ventricosum]
MRREYLSFPLSQQRRTHNHVSSFHFTGTRQRRRCFHCRRRRLLHSLFAAHAPVASRCHPPLDAASSFNPLPPCWTRSNTRSAPISLASFDPLSYSLNHPKRRRLLEQQHRPPLFLLPFAAAVLLSQPLVAAIGAGAVVSASFVSSSLYRSRASVAIAAADGSSRSSNYFPCILLCCCLFLSQQLPSPLSFTTLLPSVRPTSLLDRDQI